jgi:hypothetical protein
MSSHNMVDLKPLNLLNKMALLMAQGKFVGLSPADKLRLTDDINRKRERAFRRYNRHSNWVHCGDRQRARYAKQIREGRLKKENGLVVE